MNNAQLPESKPIQVQMPGNTIRWIRAEASNVKDCFTQFSFQAITFSAGTLAFMLGSMEKLPFIVFSAIPVILVLMVVSRIGIHKYTTSNRSYGYQLYFEQTERINSKAHKILKEINWEESLRAWRIIQPALFQSIYTTPQTDKFSANLADIPVFNWICAIRTDLYQLSKGRLTKDPKDVLKKIENNKKNNRIVCDLDYPWFMPGKLTEVAEEGLGLVSNYHAGTYLRDMIRILNIMQYLLLSPMLILAVLPFIAKSEAQVEMVNNNPISSSTLFIVLVSILLIVMCRSAQLRRRRQILEGEFLCIHSCAITWHLVLLIHCRAIQETKDTFYCEYIEKVTQLTDKLKNDFYCIDKWISNQYNELEKSLEEENLINLEIVEH